MHYILFHAESYKGEDRNAEAAFLGFEEKTKRIAPTSSKSKKLGLHSWLIDRENDGALFGMIVHVAEGAQLKYTVLFLSSD